MQKKDVAIFLTLCALWAFYQGEVFSGENGEGPYSKKASSQSAAPTSTDGQTDDSTPAVVTQAVSTTAVTTTTAYTNNNTSAAGTEHETTTSTENSQTNTPSPGPVANESQLDALCDSAADDLQKLHEHVEEWGALTISQPLLMYDCGQFSLDRSVDAWSSAQKYVTDDKSQVSGGIAQLAEKVLAAKLVGEISPALPKTAVTGTTSASLADVNSGLGTSTAPPGDFSNTYMPLLGSTNSYSISNSTALSLGTSDKLKELALRTLSSPDHRLITSPSHNRLYVAVVQVSCNPGRRTQKHYIADLNATFEYYDSSSQSFSTSDGGGQPVVFSALPLLDAQTLDLKNSQEDEFSLFVALMGTLPQSAVNGQLGAVMNYLNKYQRDSQTRSAIPVVGSYATSFGFGFRISPSYEAISDPTDKDSAGDNVLLPTTFPAIVFLLMDPDDVIANNHHYDQVVTHVGCHWYRKQDEWFFPREEEDVHSSLEMATLIRKLDSKLRRIKAKLQALGLSSFDQRYLQLRRDRLQFEPLGVGASFTSATPSDLLQVQTSTVTTTKTITTKKTANSSTTTTNIVTTTTTPRTVSFPTVVETIDPPFIDPAKGGYFVISGRHLDQTKEVIVGDQTAFIQQYPVYPDPMQSGTTTPTETGTTLPDAKEIKETGTFDYPPLFSGTTAISSTAGTIHGASAQLSPNSLVIFVNPFVGGRWPQGQSNMEVPPIPVVVVTNHGEARGTLKLMIPALTTGTTPPPASAPAPAPAVTGTIQMASTAPISVSTSGQFTVQPISSGSLAGVPLVGSAGQIILAPIQTGTTAAAGPVMIGTAGQVTIAPIK